MLSRLITNRRVLQLSQPLIGLIADFRLSSHKNNKQFSFRRMSVDIWKAIWKRKIDRKAYDSRMETSSAEPRFECISNSNWIFGLIFRRF